MGYLEIIFGPMFSGKSSRLIQISRKYKTLNQKILIVKPIIDNRYSERSEIVTHDKITEPCMLCNDLCVIVNIIDKYDVILIEEAQFFPELYTYVVEWCKTKHVYVAGLNGDAKKQLFGEIYKLIPHADEVIFMKALCKICNDGTSAVFTQKLISSNNNVIQVGGENIYSAVCRKHFT